VRDPSEMSKWKEPDFSTANEIERAAYILGSIYYDGLGIPASKTEASRWFRKVSEAYPDRSNLEGVKKNNDLADKVRKTIQQGNAEERAYAMAELGLMYEYGIGGVKKDLTQAVAWYQKAVAGKISVPDAYYNLGRMYDAGLGGLPKNEAEAARWFRKSAFETICEGECQSDPP
jgi:uncharacterized protein